MALIGIKSITIHLDDPKNSGFNTNLGSFRIVYISPLGGVPSHILLLCIKYIGSNIIILSDFHLSISYMALPPECMS